MNAQSGGNTRHAKFQALCQALRPDLLRFAFWLSRDRTLAEDVVQESLLRAWKSQDALQDDKAMKPWLLTIIRREYARTFERKRLPRPRVQVESTMLLMLPALIAETGLLSFISRHHLDAADARSPLREVPLRETTMRRRLVVSYRASSYLAPATELLIRLLGEAAGLARRELPPDERLVRG